MMSQRAGAWRLALPMYNVTPGLQQAWEQLMHALVAGLRLRGWTGHMHLATGIPDLMAFWAAPDLLLSQTCGYPLATRLRGAVHLLGTPAFNLPYCAGLRYCSVLLVREDAGLRSLEDLRGKRAVFNEAHSQSGMNALRHCVAPLARDGGFFGGVCATGSHRLGMEAVQSGQADVVAIDCVHYAYAKRDAPERVAGLRVLQTSRQVPGLPFIASGHLDESELLELKQVLYGLPAAHPDLAAQLALVSIEPTRLADYQPILEMENEAVALGYPVLA
jgi:ABC-type phosphate/phosphonate transport system substrate-binding protein